MASHLTVKFEELSGLEESTRPYIDFSKSSGSVCLYYNPVQNGDTHKYLNPSDWKRFISVKHPHKFMPFMFINTVEDLEGINNNPSGNYVLGDDISIPLKDRGASNPSIATQFKGRLYSNERRLFSQLLPEDGFEGKATRTEVESEVDIPLEKVACKTCFDDNIYLRFGNIWEQFLHSLSSSSFASGDV